GRDRGSVSLFRRTTRHGIRLWPEKESRPLQVTSQTSMAFLTRPHGAASRNRVVWPVETEWVAILFRPTFDFQDGAARRKGLADPPARPCWTMPCVAITMTGRIAGPASWSTPHVRRSTPE